MIIAIIAAISENRAVGLNNSLPWHIPNDLKYFKRITMGKAIIMGRKTYDSLKKPLVGRQNIVITNQEKHNSENLFFVTTIEEAINLAEKHAKITHTDEIMIIGGASIYRQTLPLANRLYLTQIHKKYNGDTYFPIFSLNDWFEVSKQTHETENKTRYSFIVLDHRK